MGKVLITDTILRDAHQSQAATRMRLEEMLPVADKLDKIGYYSLECWGGATFDSCMRFLNEDPWERLRALRKAMPNTKLQMLFRGQNILGYKHYADDVVDELVDRYGDPPRAVNNLVSIALLRSQAAQCGFTDISQKGLVLTFSMKEFELQKIAALSGVARFKGRILFSPGKDSSALSLRLKPGEDVLAAGRRLVETYRQLLEQKQEA